MESLEDKPDGLSLVPKPTWWKDRADSQSLPSDLYLCVHTRTDNKCMNVKTKFNLDVLGIVVHAHGPRYLGGKGHMSPRVWEQPGLHHSPAR